MYIDISQHVVLLLFSLFLFPFVCNTHTVYMHCGRAVVRCVQDMRLNSSLLSWVRPSSTDQNRSNANARERYYFNAKSVLMLNKLAEMLYAESLIQSVFRPHTYTPSAAATTDWLSYTRQLKVHGKKLKIKSISMIYWVRCIACGFSKRVNKCHTRKHSHAHIRSRSANRNFQSQHKRKFVSNMLYHFHLLVAAWIFCRWFFLSSSAISLVFSSFSKPKAIWWVAVAHKIWFLMRANKTFRHVHRSTYKIKLKIEERPTPTCAHRQLRYMKWDERGKKRRRNKP